MGLGNILLGDEGVGVHVINKLREEWSFSPEIEIIDGGTLGLDLLPYLEKYSKILIVDAVEFGKEPGYISILSDTEIIKSLGKKFSVHHIGLSDILFACQLVNIKPDEVIIIGIQPKSLDVGIEMTDEICCRIPDLTEMIIHNLTKWGIKCVSLSPQR